MPEFEPACEPEFDLGNEPGFLGDASHSLRARELYQYYQPPLPNCRQHSSKDECSLRSSHDPILTCLTLLLSKLLGCRRSFLTLVDRERSLVVAESTQSLSVVTPHTYAPGDELWIGGDNEACSEGGLCEQTVSLQPEKDGDNEALVLEVLNLAEHPRYRNAVYVRGWPSERFYAGVALRTRNGVSIGTLCVLDPTPRPNGLSEAERLTLVKMGDNVMNYLETLKGDRDMKRGCLMEMGLSAFIAGSYLADGAEARTSSWGEPMDDKLWSEQDLLERARNEKARVDRVHDAQARAQKDLAANLPPLEPEKREVQQSFFQTTARPAPMESAPHLDTLVASMPHQQAQGIVESPVSGFNGSRCADDMTPSGSPAAGSWPFTPKARQKSSSFTSAPPSTTPSPRKSNRSESSQYDFSMRDTFGRAASVIRDCIDANVVFLDGDWDGGYMRDDAPFHGVHVSAERDGETTNRPPRRRNSRRTSGILGYATSAGSSLSQTEGEHPRKRRTANLGFDVLELPSEFLDALVQAYPQGHIFGYHSLESSVSKEKNEEPKHERLGKDIFEKFLPGCSSIVFLPLYDHSHVVFSLCFVWTCSPMRAFSGDMEGVYLTAFSNSIMAEVTRLSVIGADKAKGEFISSVSHELRSPLHGILASADFLDDTKLNPFQRSFVETIISCGRTLLDTINHVLDFQKLNSLEASRSQQPALPTNDSSDSSDSQLTAADILTEPGDGTGSIGNMVAETDLALLAEDVADGINLGYKFKGITTPGIMDNGGDGNYVKFVDTKANVTMIVDIEHREDGWNFLCQPGALKRILLNLGGNALKYTDSGWVRIHVSAQNLPPEDSDEQQALIKISVSDSGKGISREFLKTRLFTPFSQENPLIPGTGLGMSIVHQIVRMMPGGEIDVRSEVGIGTKVEVQFVLKHRPKWSSLQVMQHVDDEILRVAQETRGKKVLLLDGFETNREPVQNTAYEMLRQSLERYARDWFGLTILQKDDTSKPDYVITNESVGDPELLLDAKDAALWRDVPIIVLCSSAPTDELSRMYQTRADVVTFTSKPCGPRKLAHALAVCLEKDASAAAVDPMDSIIPSMPHPAQENNIDTQPPIRPSITTRSYSVMERGSYGSAYQADNSFQATTVLVPKLLPSPPIINSQFILKSQKARVLAVEDNSINLMLLTTFLKRAGNPYEKAVNGLEALRAVENSDKGFDVILMDLQMPVMSGLESTQEIRKLERKRAESGQSIKRSVIVALTGLATASDKEEAFAAGVDTFMVKPVKFDDLRRWLERPS